MHLSLVEGALGGIGLFLLGMRLMSEGIRTVADNRIRGVLATFTANRLYCLLFGAVMSLALNSASAAVIFTIGLANGGVLTAFQALNVLGGVLVGASLTLYLPIVPYSLVATPLIFTGVLLKFFARRRRFANAGDLLLGAGLLFLGLTLLEGSFRPFDRHPFYGVINDTIFNSTYLAMLFGGMISCFVQSALSSANIISELAIGHQLSAETAGSMVLGGFIGVAAIGGLASVGGTSVSRRIALVFMIITVAVILPLVAFTPSLPDAPQWLRPLLRGDPAQQQLFSQLRWTHAVAALLTAILTTLLSGLISRILGVTEGHAGNGAMPQPCAGYLDTRILNTPTLAIEQARKEIIRMMSVTSYMYADIREIFSDFDARRAETIRQHEQVLDSLNHEITVFLAALARSSTSTGISFEIPGLFQTVADLEHIGDRCEEILDCIVDRKESGVVFSDSAMDDLKRLADVVGVTFSCAEEVVKNGQITDGCELRDLKAQLRAIVEGIKRTHFDRISSGMCPPRAAVLFNELTTAFVRIAELCWNLMASQGRDADERQNRGH
ncbi:MAG: Na/Pi cotransporter family protein [Deltaproteobacteria bacterium]|nr:Na/Pi cotransporter family protein [Deltaproteobacteria bacterium]